MRDSAETASPEFESATGPRAAERLSALPLFAGLDAVAFDAIDAELDFFSVPAGWTLFREGDVGDALYIVTYGLLAVTTTGTDGKERLVAEIHGGETVGEMALISGQPRSATVIAYRDTEVLRLGREAWNRIAERYPRAMLNVAAIIAARLNRTTHFTAWSRAVKTLAVLAATPDVPCPTLARGLTETLIEAGRRAQLVEADAAEHTTEWFSALEEANDLLVFRGELDGSFWTKLCLRQADRVLLIARAKRELPPPNVLEALAAPGRRIDLVLLHETDDVAHRATEAWLARVPVDLVCHVRIGRRSDLQRLGRVLTGRAVGLVLAGAGARGFAHIGVVRALREAQVPIDLVGGTSMGAIIAAGIALEWNDKELRERVYRVFVKNSPVNDLTLPLLALVKGRKVARLLRENFAETVIEDLWLPYFCISTNLTSGRAEVHKRGLLWRALQASTAIPGLLPPVVEGGDVLVDGGVVNNFPTDVMAAVRRGPVIGVNVINDKALESMSRVVEQGSLWQLLRNGGWKSPPIVSILTRAGTMTSETQTQLCRDYADLLLEPPLLGVDFLDWKAFDKAIEIGYRYTMEQLERQGDTLWAPLAVTPPV
jgi:NTE family protein